MLVLSLLLLLHLSHLSLSLNQEGILLLEAKNSLDDTNLSFSDWNPSDPTPCNWTGISCSASANDDPTVTSINLSSLGLVGPFPAILCRLLSLSSLTISYNRISSNLTPASLLPCTSLSHLDLNHNHLSGPLPTSLASLPLLRYLDLSYNFFSGPIPPSFAHFPHLEVLFLIHNHLEFTIPSFLANISSLHGLDLSENPFSPGPIPASFGNLSSLGNLQLSGCNLVGPIPPSLGHLSALTTLNLAFNSLSGPIPATITYLSNAVDIALQSNALSDPIPTALSNLTSLRNIDASLNNLHGPITADLFLAPCLEAVYLYQNQLSGPLPPTISHSLHLKEIDLFSNSLSGAFPADFGKKNPLTFVELSDNYLSGAIPATICDGGALEMLIIRNNSFSGVLPESLGRCRTLNRIRLANNCLSGEVPTSLWALPHVYLLELSANSLTGGISPAIASASNLSTLLISDNQFTGTIPSEIGALLGLSEFSASNNWLTGLLPTALGSLLGLVRLDLHNNSLSGELPREIQSCGKLSLLDLSGNLISGEIPSELGDLPVLSYLDPSSNALTGEIPLQLQDLKLNLLNLSNNQLLGRLPPLFASRTYCHSFLGNPGLNGDLGNLCSNLQEGMLGHQTFTLLLRFFIILSTIVFFAGYIWFSWRHHNSKETKLRMYKLEWTVTGFYQLPFCWYEILDCLNEENVVGSGASGKVYKVVLNNGKAVAVKKICGSSSRDMDRILDDNFEAEVAALGKIRHRNIVKLWCCYVHKSCKLLVYEYMPNGSLGDLLHKNRGVFLDWPMRYKIVLDAAKGLSYLHHACDPPIVHRDVKSNNILVDEEFGACLADFGVAKVIGKDMGSVTVIVGAWGYIAPEYAYTFRVNEKSDVYSFGIVILEMVTGKLPIDPEIGEKGMVNWVCSKIEQEGLDYVLDPKIDTRFREEMCRVLDIGLLCSHSLPADRPSMKMVVRTLLEMTQENKIKHEEMDKMSQVLHARDRAYDAGSWSCKFEDSCIM